MGHQTLKSKPLGRPKRQMVMATQSSKVIYINQKFVNVTEIQWPWSPSDLYK